MNDEDRMTIQKFWYLPPPPPPPSPSYALRDVLRTNRSLAGGYSINASLEIPACHLLKDITSPPSQPSTYILSILYKQLVCGPVRADSLVSVMFSVYREEKCSPTLTQGRKDRDKYFIYLGGDSGCWLSLHPVPVWYHKLSPPAYKPDIWTVLPCISHQQPSMPPPTFHLCPLSALRVNLENVCCVVKAGGQEKCFNQNNYCLLKGAVSVCSSPCSPIFMTYWLENLISNWRVRKFSGKFLQIISMEFLFSSYPFLHNN